MPKCWIIAGPNGAGKTTFALDYLNKDKDFPGNFINADLIAAGLSPLNPEKEVFNASRILLLKINENIERKQDFAFETTLSGKTYLKLVQRLKLLGWSVTLIYLALPNMAMSKQRVAERVKHGGHNIPAKDIERRFSRSLNNLLKHFSNIVDNCLCFMNEGKKPVLIFSQKNGYRVIHNSNYYELLQKDLSDENKI